MVLAGSNCGISPPRGLAEGNLRLDGGAFARGGLDIEMAADHLQTFPHAEQSQSFVLFGVQHVFRLKAFAVVFYGHANGVIQFLNLHVRPAGLRVAGDVGERFLGDAIEHGAFVTVHLLNRRNG